LVRAAWQDRRVPARRGLAGLIPSAELGRVWAEAGLRRDALPAEVPPAVWAALAGSLTLSR
jgi:hypothetical protein